MIRDGTTTIIMGIFSFLAGCGYTPAPANFRLSDKLLFARGWSEAELRKIIADFEHMYTGRLPASFSNNIDSDEHGVLRVSLPNDIEPRFFCWLINYVQYPKNFDFRARSILAAGTATVAENFLPSSGESYVGKRIVLYIPTHDTGYDLLYGRVGGKSYEYLFSSERWRRVEDARIPDGLDQVLQPNQTLEPTASRSDL
jgi:hypothetical protein